MTRYGTPSGAWPWSSTETTWGWDSRAADRASRTNRSAAAGSSATEAPFVLAGGDPLTSLLGFQVEDSAFTYPGSDGAPNVLATEQAVWGAMPRAFPLGLVTFVDGPTSSTTTTTAGSGPAAPADPVQTTAAFTG